MRGALYLLFPTVTWAGDAGTPRVPSNSVERCEGQKAFLVDFFVKFDDVSRVLNLILRPRP